MTTTHEALHEALAQATRFLDGLAARPVGRPVSAQALRERLGGPLPRSGPGPDAASVIRDLAAAADEGLVATAGPRFFGFVTGGTLPAALAADWLTATWDQNPCLHVQAPAASVVESVVVDWLLQLLGLPSGAGVGLVTGGQMANFTGLLAARGAVLRRAGHDPDADGLAGAPPVTVVVGGEAHATIFSALRMLGIGRRQIRVAEADAEGRMRPDRLAAVLAGGDGPALAPTQPVIVCAQAGNVNTGAFDPLDEVARIAHAHGAWLHVDGAFGLWAGASPRLAHMVRGVAEADSWATDAHKWLNVPYDCGIAIVRDAEAHRRGVAAAMAPYLVAAQPGERDGQDWVPEASRRARAFPVYAAIRALGRDGVAAMVERGCALAARAAQRLAELPGVTVLNQVVLNQILIRFDRPAVDSAALTRAVIERAQREGTCWVGPTVWQGQTAMRFSVSCWRTSEEDIDRAVGAIAAASFAAAAA
jgi:glutamate/tyrosine decarboxylase-like PLP-dependent enzyme